MAEDEAMLASEVAEALAAKGCVVVGPTRSLEDSLAAAERDAIDVAVLDANLAGRDSKPVAEALARRGVPFVLASGYQDRDIEAVFGAVPRLAKPYSLELLLQAIVGLLQRPG